MENVLTVEQYFLMILLMVYVRVATYVGDEDVEDYDYDASPEDVLPIVYLDMKKNVLYVRDHGKTFANYLLMNVLLQHLITHD